MGIKEIDSWSQAQDQVQEKLFNLSVMPFTRRHQLDDILQNWLVKVEKYLKNHEEMDKNRNIRFYQILKNFQDFINEFRAEYNPSQLNIIQEKQQDILKKLQESEIQNDKIYAKLDASTEYFMHETQMIREQMEALFTLVKDLSLQSNKSDPLVSPNLTYSRTNDWEERKPYLKELDYSLEKLRNKRQQMENDNAYLRENPPQLFMKQKQIHSQRKKQKALRLFWNVLPFVFGAIFIVWILWSWIVKIF